MALKRKESLLYMLLETEIMATAACISVTVYVELLQFLKALRTNLYKATIK